MEAELQERVESSQKQAIRVVEIYECLRNTVDQLKAELDSGAGEEKETIKSFCSVFVCIHIKCDYVAFGFQRAICGRWHQN